MKKLFSIVCMMLISTAMFAQQGKMAIGVNANYGLHSDYKNLGFGVKGQYGFTDNLRAELSGNYFLEKDNCTMWDVNLNAHYVIPVSNGIAVYPLAGVSLLGTKVDISEISYNVPGYGNVGGGGGSASDTSFGFNAGAGVEFAITNSLKANIEGKYQIVKDWNRPVVSVGLAYCF